MNLTLLHLLQWMVDEKELRVIHYTLGPLKPWDWWTAWLVKPVAVWQVNIYFSCGFKQNVKQQHGINKLVLFCRTLGKILKNLFLELVEGKPHMISWWSKFFSCFPFACCCVVIMDHAFRLKSFPC